MATQFSRSVWPRNRSWSTAEEEMLVQKAEEGIGLDELVGFFRRSKESIRLKAAKLGYVLSVSDPNPGGRPAALTDEEVEGLIQFYERTSPTPTLKEIAAFCYQILGVEVCPHTVGVYFRKFRVHMSLGRRNGKKYPKKRRK